MHTEHIRDEELIEIALEDRPESRREAASCPRCSARLGEWQSFLGVARARLLAPRVPEAAIARELAQSILQQTTREGVRTSRGPRLAAASARRTPHAVSWPWRIFAASLALLIGWAAFDQFVRARTGTTAGDLELASAPSSPSPSESDSLTAGAELGKAAGVTAAGSQEHAPQQFDSGAAPSADAAPQTVVGRILGSRSAWLHERTPLEPREIAAAASVPAARALLCEHVLDRFALEDYIPEGFDRGIQSLLSASTANRAERRLELAALARARDYGLLDVAEEHDLGEALAKAGVDPGADPLFAEGARTREPIDSAWLSALAASLGGAERCDPVVQAWLARR
jgi:hypothetical protein